MSGNIKGAARTLNDLLRDNDKGINPEHVLVLRHAPPESKLRKELPRLAAEEPKLFNAYQQTQTKEVEQRMKEKDTKFVASFIGYRKPAKTLFVGLYSVDEKKPLTRDECRKKPEYVELKKTFDYEVWPEEDERPKILWFDLVPTGIYDHLKGRLLVEWPKPYRVWSWRANTREMPIESILKENVLGTRKPDWKAVDPDAEELRGTLTADLTDIIGNKQIDATVKKTLVDARVGQGKFRLDVLRLWESRCSVTGSSTTDAIRASHIMPWRKSTNEERLDPMNGLPLVASLDALFDAGLISFDASGQMLVSPELEPPERRIFDVDRKALRKKPPGDTARYLQYHRDKVFHK